MVVVGEVVKEERKKGVRNAAGHHPVGQRHPDEAAVVGNHQQGKRAGHVHDRLHALEQRPLLGLVQEPEEGVLEDEQRPAHRQHDCRALAAEVVRVTLAVVGVLVMQQMDRPPRPERGERAKAGEGEAAEESVHEGHTRNGPVGSLVRHREHRQHCDGDQAYGGGAAEQQMRVERRTPRNHGGGGQPEENGRRSDAWHVEERLADAGMEAVQQA
mmetsp:Transcript_15955/g.62336  ORF Transcript_15955/g.62336 Transcript_15955/m.62336 type:complete len:214 (+) Transcript_15955:292-933(+)